MQDKPDLKQASRTCLNCIEQVKHYIQMMLSDPAYDPHASTLNHLNKLIDICDTTLMSAEIISLDEPKPELHPSYIGTVVASCDASIKENPGGPASCGVVITFPNPGEQDRQISRVLPTATTNNQAEYDAVYEAIMSMLTFGIGSNVNLIEIRTDSKLVCKQLNNEWKVKDDKLMHRYKSVTEQVQKLRDITKVPVVINWYPRNSTDDMKQANYLAQDCLGVRRH